MEQIQLLHMADKSENFVQIKLSARKFKKSAIRIQASVVRRFYFITMNSNRNSKILNLTIPTDSKARKMRENVKNLKDYSIH